MNPGKVPIQEISSGSGGQKLAKLNHYVQLLFTNDKRCNWVKRS